MKKWLLFFCLITASVFAEGKVVLASYQRCGTHWLGYCLYQLLENYDFNYAKEYGDIARFIEPLRSKNPSGIKFQRGHVLVDSSLQKRLTINEVSISPETDVLIVLLRDYKECYIRHQDRRYRGPIDMFIREPVYFNNLEAYHHWDPARRYLIYYEDLMTDPRGTLQDLLTFLGEEEEGLDRFIEDIDLHRQVVLDAYDQRWRSVTKGEDLHYHKEHADPAVLEKMDQIVLSKYPHLLPYLERYLPN